MKQGMTQLAERNVKLEEMLSAIVKYHVGWTSVCVCVCVCYYVHNVGIIHNIRMVVYVHYVSLYLYACTMPAVCVYPYASVCVCVCVCVYNI